MKVRTNTFIATEAQYYDQTLNRDISIVVSLFLQCDVVSQPRRIETLNTWTWKPRNSHRRPPPRGTPPWQWPKKGQVGRTTYCKESEDYAGSSWTSSRVTQLARPKQRSQMQQLSSTAYPKIKFWTSRLGLSHMISNPNLLFQNSSHGLRISVYCNGTGKRKWIWQLVHRM